MTELWDEERLGALVGSEAGTRFEFIGGAELGRGKGRLAEILTKEVSAFANTAGGVLILGLAEQNKKKGARRGDGLDGVPNTDPWRVRRIRQVIDSNLYPSLPGLKVSWVPLSMFKGKRAVVVIEVPASQNVHQAKDRLYYGRSDAQSVALHDSEIRLRMERSRLSSAYVTVDTRLVISAQRVRQEQLYERSWMEDVRQKTGKAAHERGEEASQDSAPIPTTPNPDVSDPRICFDEYIADFTVVNNGEKTLRDFDLVVEVWARNGCTAWARGELRPQPLGGFKTGNGMPGECKVYHVECRRSDWDRRNSGPGRIFPKDSMAVGGGVNVFVPEHLNPGSPQGYIGQSLGVIFPQERSLSDDQETQACRGWSILGET